MNGRNSSSSPLLLLFEPEEEDEKPFINPLRPVVESTGGRVSEPF